jgi:hypothetical protein
MDEIMKKQNIQTTVSVEKEGKNWLPESKENLIS